MNADASTRAVSVIIATAARAERAAALRRAIDGVAALEPTPEIIVVVNGSGCDPSVVRWLQSDRRVRYDYQTLGSYPAAQRRGRELVRTPFFAFLDDDDELLEGSLARRLARMAAPDAPDVVVSAGLRHDGRSERPYVSHLPAEGDDLMLELLRENWFASSSPLFRSERVGIEFFDGQTKHYEWTLIGFRLLAAGRRFGIVDTPGFRVNDSPQSLSKNPTATLFTPVLLGRLLAMATRPAVRDALRRRLAAAHHACADFEWRAGHLGTAWRHHLKSLWLPGGMRYLTFSRHLLRTRPPVQ